MVAPKQIAILNNLAWVEYKIGDLDAAEQSSLKAMNISPRHPLLMHTYALVLYKKGEKDKAISILQEATSLAPENKTISEHLAKAKKGELNVVE